MNVDAFVKTNKLNWTKRISIILTTPNGTKDVINKSVTHSQFASYASTTTTGTFQLRFVENDKFTWDCWYIIADFNVVSKSNVRKAMSSKGKTINYILAKDKGRVYNIRTDLQENSSTFSNDNNKKNY